MSRNSNRTVYLRKGEEEIWDEAKALFPDLSAVIVRALRVEIDREKERRRTPLVEMQDS